MFSLVIAAIAEAFITALSNKVANHFVKTNKSITISPKFTFVINNIYYRSKRYVESDDNSYKNPLIIGFLYIGLSLIAIINYSLILVVTFLFFIFISIILYYFLEPKRETHLFIYFAQAFNISSCLMLFHYSDKANFIKKLFQQSELIITEYLIDIVMFIPLVGFYILTIFTLIQCYRLDKLKINKNTMRGLLIVNFVSLIILIFLPKILTILPKVL